MPPIWIPRIVLLFFVLTAASGAALVSRILYEMHPPAETKAATTAATVAPAADVGDERSAALAKAHRPAVSPGSPDSGDEIPAFDFVLVGRAGDAVIAGTAAPGAAVELLRNGEVLDRAIADQFGRFVMNPSPLSSGDYDLTLRSRQGSGKQATSRRSVAVTVQPTPTDQNTALTTPDKASVIPAKPVVATSIVREPSRRARREPKGSAAQHVSGLRTKLFNQVVGPHR